MYDRDPFQKLRTPKRGEEISASLMAKIRALILQTVKGGNGINVQRVGESVIVSQRNAIAPGGGGVGGGVVYTAATKAGLTDASTVSETSFARVTAGADMGMMCVVNPDKDGWNSFTHWE